MTSCVACFLVEGTKSRPGDEAVGGGGGGGGGGDGVVQSLEGRGIVFSTRRLLVPLIIANLDTLRWMGCTLPVEVFSEEEWEERHVRRLAELGAIARRTQGVDTANMLSNLHSKYRVKTSGLVESTFRYEVAVGWGVWV